MASLSARHRGRSRIASTIYKHGSSVTGDRMIMAFMLKMQRLFTHGTKHCLLVNQHYFYLAHTWKPFISF